jgi:hypothetical protein
MNTTQLQATINFWGKDGHFNLVLYESYLQIKSGENFAILTKGSTEPNALQLPEGRDFNH